MQPIVPINDPKFVEKMDRWFQLVNFKREWSAQIPTYLSYFVYWCHLTNLSLEVNSTEYAGYYPYASVNFDNYVKNIKQLKFKHGYPFSVTNEGGIILVYQRCFDDFLYYRSEIDPITKANPQLFVKQFNENLHFRYEGEDTTIYNPDDEYFSDAIECEINNLFLQDPVPYGPSKIRK